MSKFKYTTDGKKVVVIGDLNQTEKIVQEIFVTDDGAEIPSGERFVVKSLLDEPAKTWKEQNLANLESRYEQDSKEWERKIEHLNSQKRNAYDSLSTRVKWLRQVAKQPHPDKLKSVIKTLALFLSNEDKWVLVRNYSGWKFERFNEDGCNSLLASNDSYGRGRFDSMRLLSLYGNSNGDFEYKVDGYSDGSGSGDTVLFFKSKQEGIAFMQREFDALESYTDTHLKDAKKYGLELDNNTLLKYKQKVAANLKKDIEYSLAKLAKERLALENVYKSDIYE